MYALLTYDIVSNRERTKLHKFLKEFGLNTQKSVFECDLDQEGVHRIIRYVRDNLDPENDHFRIYGFCNRCYRRVEVSGKGLSLVVVDHMVV